MISSHIHHLLPSSRIGILYVFSPTVCVTTEVPPIFVMAGGSRWHGRKQTRTAIGPSEEGDRLGHDKSVTAQYAPPDLSVEAQHRQNEESVKERTIEPLEDPTHKEAVTPTDVDYSQHEENRHERISILYAGTEENIASPVRREHSKSGSLLLM
ncbi:hypothetical protein Bca52824_026473 [Brassica carinata]|uniref:Uncharacterized protein n=1 Tax=Brassica carinata TaxID=52824 RepID=A0A8X7SHS0_BRACI|nr:hypothetical protein Bca52824_026473 [Brassica carinata]